MKMRNKDYETIVKLLEQNNELLEFLNNKVTLATLNELYDWGKNRIDAKNE